MGVFAWFRLTSSFDHLTNLGEGKVNVPRVF